MSNISIVIVEDEAIIAQDIAYKITTLGYDVEKIIHNGDKAIDYLSFHTPDLILCDIRIKGTKDGIEVAEAIRSKKNVPFVFLTSMSDRETLNRAKKTLPYGYIVKPFNDKDLFSVIEMAIYKFSQEIESLKITKDKINLLTHSAITDREYEILECMIQGLPNKDIPEKLFISINTLKYHIKNLFAKFEVSSRAEALQKILTLVTHPN